ncbi:unnamed protein product [Schistosoma turkestanicum]|nr:unnamed protein product [Schistosoma turkestanicum]
MESRVKDAVQRLDFLHQQLIHYKPLLNQNVLNTAYEIQSNFHKFMKLLTERQTNLLDQLHELANKKSMLIESENIQLNEIISTFGQLTSKYANHFNVPNGLLQQQEDKETEQRMNEKDLGDASPIFHCIQSSSSCVCQNPTLRQWLSLTEEHQCQQSHSFNRKDEEEKRTSLNMQNNYVWLNKKLSEKQSIPNQFHADNSPSTNTIARLTPSSCCLNQSNCMLIHHRHWLKSGDNQPMTGTATSCLKGEAEEGGECEGVEEEEELELNSNNNNKFSQYSNKSTSGSFDILTNSSQNISNFKDWLFCDPAEFSNNMSGLSTKHDYDVTPTTTATTTNSNSSRSSTSSSADGYNTQSDMYSWLIPDNKTVSVHTKLSSLDIDSSSKMNSLFPEHLFQTGQPIDLSRWLRQQSTSSPLLTSSLQLLANNNHVNCELPMEQIQSISEEEHNNAVLQTNEISSMNSTGQIQTMNSNINNNNNNNSLCHDDITIEYCPKFGICQGGPGGPTCCGGVGGGGRGCSLSMRQTKNPVNLSMQSIQSVNHDNSMFNTASSWFNDQFDSAFDNSHATSTTTTTNNNNDNNDNDNNNNNNSIVIELNRIANSELKQWIINSNNSRHNSLDCSPVLLNMNKQWTIMDSMPQNYVTSSVLQGKSSKIDTRINANEAYGIDEELDEPDTTLSNQYLPPPSPSRHHHHHPGDHRDRSILLSPPCIDENNECQLTDSNHNLFVSVKHSTYTDWLI